MQQQQKQIESRPISRQQIDAPRCRRRRHDFVVTLIINSRDVRLFVFVLFVRLIGKNCLFEQDFGWQLVRSINRLRIPPKIPLYPAECGK